MTALPPVVASIPTPTAVSPVLTLPVSTSLPNAVQPLGVNVPLQQSASIPKNDVFSAGVSATLPAPVAPSTPPPLPKLAKPPASKGDPLATPFSIPDEATLDEQFKLTKRWKEGAVKGAIVGALASPIVFAGNYYGNKQAISERLVEGWLVPGFKYIKHLVTPDAKIMAENALKDNVKQSLKQAGAESAQIIHQALELIAPPFEHPETGTIPESIEALQHWLGTTHNNLNAVLSEDTIPSNHKTDLIGSALTKIKETIDGTFNKLPTEASSESLTALKSRLSDGYAYAHQNCNLANGQLILKKSALIDYVSGVNTALHEHFKTGELFQGNDKLPANAFEEIIKDLESDANKITKHSSNFEHWKNSLAMQFKAGVKTILSSSELRANVEKDGLGAHSLNFAKALGYAVVDGLKIGGILGVALATLQVGEVKRQLHDIRQTAKGDTPRKHWDEFMGKIDPSRRRITDPDKSLDYVKQHELSPDHAFENGVKQTLIVKGALGALGLGKAFGAYALMAGTALSGALFVDEKERIEKSNETFNLFKSVPKNVGKGFTEGAALFWHEIVIPFATQPAIVSKVLLAPLMGGWIAMNMVPWMNKQLGRPTTLPEQSTPPVTLPPTTQPTATATAQPVQSPSSEQPVATNPYYYYRSRSSDESTPNTWNRSSTTNSTKPLFYQEDPLPSDTASPLKVAFTEEPTSATASQAITLSESFPLEESHVSATGANRSAHSESHSTTPHGEPHSTSHGESHSSSHSSSHPSGGGHH